MDTINSNRVNTNPNRNNSSLAFDNTGVNMVKQKLVVVGDIAVGKTTIINSLLGQKFKDTYEPSVGVDFFTKNIKFKGKNIKLQIWDSAGQEKYRSLIKNYIRGSSIILIIYDITSIIINYINIRQKFF
jgi:Ras-related protein Rab-6A